MATLVHAFVTSKVDYRNLLLAGCNKAVNDKLQRIMNAAARVVSGTRKYDRGLRQLRHAELHWLDVADRVTFKLCMTVHKCLHSHARTTCPSCVRRNPKSPNDSTFVWPATAYSSCQEYSSTRTAVVRSPWLVRPSATHSATICAIQISASPASVAYLRRICFSSTWCADRIRGTDFDIRYRNIKIINFNHCRYLGVYIDRFEMD